MNDIYRRAIAHSFMNLCEKKNMKDVTVSEITEACGINRKTFYNHFHDKYDVMSFLFNEACEKISAPMSDRTITIREGIVQMFRIAHENKAYYTSIARLGGQNSFEEEFLSVTTNFYKSYIQKYYPEMKLSPALLFSIDFYCVACGSFFIRWVLNDMKETPETIALWLYDCMPPRLKSLLKE